MAPFDHRSNDVEAGNKRQDSVPHALANLLADRELQARAHRRHLHVTLWPSVLLTFSIGVLVGFAWDCG
ncbi:MAG: hypothetical protein MUC89_06575 [Acetobacteraceae bacterium]|jgi:hypothetical protein|nr:hypothetical protein [Acetobacteraceae bacterium]